MMLGLMMVWISVPVQAQNVIEDEGIETALARIGEGGY